MKLVKVAAACLNQTPFAWEQNLANIRDAIRRARTEDVTVLCLPELCITGYGCEDAFFAPGLQEAAFAALESLVPETAGMVVSFGLPLYFEKALYNAACLAVDGKIAGFVAKRFLAGDGIHYEPRWFKEWPAGERDHLERGAARFPLGDVLFDVGDVRIGFEICEDAWVANRPGADLALRGVDLILNPSASHFGFGKFAVRQRFVVEGSRAFGVGYLYANLLGNEARRSKVGFRACARSGPWAVSVRHANCGSAERTASASDSGPCSTSTVSGSTAAAVSGAGSASPHAARSRAAPVRIVFPTSARTRSIA
jgi:NAD+ synthase (glutamine-hydrolysing)